MHDAVTVRKAGVPATAIITDGFVETAKAMSRVSGMPDFPFVVIAHPIANNDDRTLWNKAGEALPKCEAILLRRARSANPIGRSLD